jgi:hypothetical protein
LVADAASRLTQQVTLITALMGLVRTAGSGRGNLCMIDHAR